MYRNLRKEKKNSIRKKVNFFFLAAPILFLPCIPISPNLQISLKNNFISR